MAERRRTRRPRIKKFEVTDYQKEALKSLMPPEDLTVSEWAEKYRILDQKSSAAPGPWRNAKTPYLTDIMDEFNNYETEKIVFCKPTQVGGTEALQNMVGYVIDQDPAPSMIVYPTLDLAKTVSENRLVPMFDDSPTLRKKFLNDDSKNLELQFTGMYLALAGSNSPASLASRPIRYLFLDEIDKFPGASNKEADPISLAEERTKTFHNRKIFEASTPTLKTGHIWQDLEGCDIIKHYFVTCPHCGKEIELKFAQIKFPDREDMSYADRAEFATYICQECGKEIDDRYKPQMLMGGRWKIVKRNTKFARSVGYWMNTLYSPFVRWSEIAKKFLTTKDDPDTFQNFVNSWLAEPWEDTKVKTNADLVLERQTSREPLVIPSWAKILTAGVDVQETSLYYTIRAWGDYLTSQNIAHGQVTSLQDVESIMNQYYPVEDTGEVRLVDLCLIDSGDQTDTIYEFTIGREDWCLPVKGSSKEMMSNFKISKINAVSSKAYGNTLVIVDGGKYKDSIAARMHRKNGTGSWMVYKGCDMEYAQQVTAEHKVKQKKNGRTVEKWVQKISHGDNHYLDAEVYAYAAADLMGVRSLHLQDQEEHETKAPKPPGLEQEMQSTPEENWISDNELKGW